MDKFVIARDNMIKGQMLPNNVTDKAVIKSIANVPRNSFAPDKFKYLSYSDSHIKLSEKRYMISPFVFAKMVQAASVSNNDVVLDVACGSGYSSAVFANIAKKVVSIESDADLASKANLLLKTLDVGNVIVLNDKMSLGSPECGPYDVIFINGAIKEVPDTLLKQLAGGGRLIAVLEKHTSGGSVVVYKKNGRKITHEELFDADIPVINDLNGDN